MAFRIGRGALAAGLMVCSSGVWAQTPAAIDRDLIEVSIPRLHGLYDSHAYTIRQVVDWYLARIARYNPVYRPVEQVFADEARALADEEDAAGGDDAAGGPSAAHGPLWGVPIVIKANTSIAGKVTTDGWDGYVIAGHELVAPRDATVVARLRRARSSSGIPTCPISPMPIPIGRARSGARAMPMTCAFRRADRRAGQ
jgi:hypothetical protein